MHDDDTPAAREAASNARADNAIQRAALAHLLARDPHSPTVAELRRELTGASEEFADTDAIERALAELVRAGLVNRQGEFVMPSVAALRFDQLGL